MNYRKSAPTNKENNLDPIGRFISDRSRMAPPTKEECDDLFVKMSKGSEDARKELIERHVRLVASIALKFRQTCVPMEDIMAEGIHGLVVALDKFDTPEESNLAHTQHGGFDNAYKDLLVKCPVRLPYHMMYPRVKEKKI